MSHRRLFSLAVAATLVLALGLYVRRSLARTNQPAAAAPPSEASALQQLSHEGLLRRASTFVSDRAAAVARYVVYVPESASSGVRWRADSVLSAGALRPLEVSVAAAADSGAPTIRELGDSVRNDWLLIAARARSGAMLSLAAAVGGRVRARCDAHNVEELLLNVPLQDHLAGAGLFDIDGALVGMVVRCGQRLAAIPTRQIQPLLARRDGLASGAEAFGASLASLDSAMRAYFRIDTGALVVAVRRGSIAETVGLRAGDVIVSIDGAAIAEAADAARVLAARPDAEHRVVRMRGRARSVLDVPRSDTGRGTTAGMSAGLGIHLPSETRRSGVAVGDIQPGSPAHAAGLRAGDKLTRIGSADVNSPADAERLFRTAPPGPIFIAFDRDSVEYGTLVRR